MNSDMYLVDILPRHNRALNYQSVSYDGQTIHPIPYIPQTEPYVNQPTYYPQASAPPLQPLQHFLASVPYQYTYPTLYPNEHLVVTTIPQDKRVQFHI